VVFFNGSFFAVPSPPFSSVLMVPLSRGGNVGRGTWAMALCGYGVSRRLRVVFDVFMFGRLCSVAVFC
jgi:hypothetical protein